MSHSPANKRLDWLEISGLAALAGLVVFGLAVNSRSLLHFLGSVAFGVTLLLMVGLGQWTFRRARPRQPWTKGQVAWQVAVFVGSLMVMLGLVRCYQD
jgi:hypothetical protein